METIIRPSAYIRPECWKLQLAIDRLTNFFTEEAPIYKPEMVEMMSKKFLKNEVFKWIISELPQEMNGLLVETREREKPLLIPRQELQEDIYEKPDDSKPWPWSEVEAHYRRKIADSL